MMKPTATPSLDPITDTHTCELQAPLWRPTTAAELQAPTGPTTVNTRPGPDGCGGDSSRSSPPAAPVASGTSLTDTISAFWHEMNKAVTQLPWPTSVLTEFSVTFVQDVLRRRVRLATAAGHAALLQRFNKAGIPLPASILHDAQLEQLDKDWPRALAALVAHEQLTPAQLVEAVRGQTDQDYRPNKALWPSDLLLLIDGYPHLHDMLRISHEGFRIPRKSSMPAQEKPPPNHGSARKYDNTLIKLMREGQAAHQYVFLDASVMHLWPHLLFFSPLGLVPKGHQPMSVIARVIQDLSYPLGGSVNDFTDKELLPLIQWPKIVQLAHRITELHRVHPSGSCFKGMTGDVAQAYRNLRAHASDCATFGISLPNHAVIGMDMSAPFGWNGSPNMYCVFGNGITWLVSRESPASINPSMSCDSRPFWCYNYMDDCIILEVDEGYRLECAALALKLAMIATLGPEAMNLKKFQDWQSEFVALGLRWNLTTSSVSMPQEKIAKAQSRVAALRLRRSACRDDLAKLLGSLRHVASCMRPARAFYQSLHRVYSSFPHFGFRTLSKAALADLDCFHTLLQMGHLANIPTEIFARSSQPSVLLQMDASNDGLAIIDTNHRRFIRLVFDDFERFMISALTNHDREAAMAQISQQYPDLDIIDEFTINVREHFAIVLAILLWGRFLHDPTGTTTVHVGVLSDNTAAVAWTNKLSSPNRFAQNLNRHLAVLCARLHLEVSAQHLPGWANEVPDAGSRPNDPKLQDLWAHATAGWSETLVPMCWRRAYLAFDPSTLLLWDQTHGRATSPRGTNGSPSGATLTESGCPQVGHHTRLHCNVGRNTSSTANIAPTASPPSSRRWPVSPGCTSVRTVTPSALQPGIELCSKDSNAAAAPASEEKLHCHPGCSLLAEPLSTSRTAATAHSGGLRSWLGSCFSDVLST